ncbi:MAG: helix-turn-helix domain-containing protein [Clostridia bacterium]|nr:helix-turn-helix domain-containing protein [Clostridia bacterium]
MRFFLSEYDDFCVVGEYNTADKAWEYIKNNHVDVVFTDIKMNNTTGLQLAERALSANVDSLFVMVSAYDEFSYALQALHIGVFDYLLKPLTKEIVEGVVIKIRKYFEKAAFEKKHYCLPKINGMNENFKILIEYLQDNYMNQIRMSDITDMFHISKSYCTQLCQKYYNMGFSKLLTKIRMENALIMLNDRALEIKEIALLTGFDDYAYFNRKFKKYFNKTPNQIRMQAAADEKEDE